MKRWWKIILLLVLSLTLGACQHGRAQVTTKEQPLIIGVDDSFVPMGFQTKAGQLTGFDVDAAKAAGKLMHRKIKFQTIDWSMKETELKNGTIDLIWNGYTKTPARVQQVNFSRAYLKNEQVMVVAKRNKITQIQQLRNRVVGVQSASTGYFDVTEKPQLLKNFIKNKTPVQYDNIQDGMMDLRSNRIEGFVIDRVFAEYYLEKAKLTDQYQVLETPFAREDFAVGVSKKRPELLKQVNQVLKQLKDTGKLKQISKKWFGEDITE
ncbi:amino acid ABC transporter substrate-binding protein [Lactobacillus sp. DCY120]|uniref:Amino acid ABC transporter substrate-binding protein n=1 Tax=Bombilactobacillus apium TaxID=2675299 RepID=A0A850RA13_9LACO|nr:amino acid ABC transporter substrate-binding protein [Bombilactobacillus apium]NVY95668.1 amino acid ABC transporter substrate-binding protein [Bombilactobacillus apium]